MTARCPTGPSGQTDYLPPTDPLTGPDQVAGGVIESCLDPHSINAAVAEEQPIAVRGVVVGPGHNAGIRGSYRGAAGGAEVRAVVELPDLEQRMEPHAETRRHWTRNRMEEAVASQSSD